MDNVNRVVIPAESPQIGKLELEVGLESESDRSEIYCTPPNEVDESTATAETALGTESTAVEEDTSTADCKQDICGTHQPTIPLCSSADDKEGVQPTSEHNADVDLEQTAPPPDSGVLCNVETAMCCPPPSTDTLPFTTNKPSAAPLQRQLTFHGSQTDWPQIRLISAILFLGCIQMFVVGMSEWPYMHEVDKRATPSFFGYVGSVSALGHALCAPLMGYWSSATGQTRNPMIAGRLIAVVGCIVYICVEMFPRDRRYVMLVCYTIFGISMSSVSVMRGYVAKVSTPSDRARAISLFGLATMLAVTVGPMFQMFFTTLTYPGVALIPGKLWLNIYTGPIYVAFAANVGSLILIVCFFKEKHFDREESGKGLERRPSRAKSALTNDLRSFNMPLALTCIFIRMTAALSIVIIHTISTPLMTLVFGWSGQLTVRIGALTQACVGILSVLLFIGFASGRLSKVLSERKAAVLSCVLFALFFLLTYPWAFASRPIPLKEPTSNVTGCDTRVYEWCEHALQVHPAIYLGSMVIVMGVAITLSTIAVDTLYSRILGSIDQGTMQGFFLFALDIVNVLGPLVIAPLFTSSGQQWVWPLGGILVGLSTLACLVAYRHLPH